MRSLLALLCLLPGLCLAQASSPKAGAWKYGYADLQYTRFKYSVTIRGTREGGSVNESLAVEGGAGTQRAVDPRSGAYLSQLLGAGRALLEYAPYGTGEGAAWPTPSGYPTYATPYIAWSYTVKPGATESVTTPAGTFRALRVEIEGNRGKDPDPFWWPKQAARFVQTVWYAPETGRYVKMHLKAWSMTGAQFGEEAVELLEYRAD